MSKVNEIIDRMKMVTNARTYEELATILGVSLSTLNSWKKRGYVPEKNILKCAHLTKTSKEFLETGEQVQPIYKQNMDTFSIPILSITASAGSAGNHLDAIDIFDTGQTLQIDRMIFRTPPQGKIRAVQIDGDSMIPRLYPGSWVLFDETARYSGDGLYVLSYSHILMVKLLQADLSSGSLHIRSINPDYDSYTIHPDNQEHFAIIGKVLRSIT